MWRPGRPVPLYFRASFAVSLVVFLFGLDTGTIGAVTVMNSFTAKFGALSETMHGLVVSSILLPAAATALLAGVLADRYGRTKVIGSGSFIFGVGATIETGAPVLGMFVAGRVIKGIGEGLFLSAAFVQVAEMSPARRRGVISALPQFMTTVGLVVGFFTCYGTAKMDLWEWSFRLPLLLEALYGYLFALLMLIVPPSPRWLVMRGRFEEARAVASTLGLDERECMELLRPPGSDLASSSATPLEQQEPQDQQDYRNRQQQQSSYFTTRSPATVTPNAEPHPESLGEGLRNMIKGFSQAFEGPYRARTIMGIFMMAFQQFSGVDGVLFYAPTLFKEAGFDSESAQFLASGVSALAIMMVSFPAMLYADHWGRRSSVVIGGVLITIEMMVMGALYAANVVRKETAASWVVIVFIYLFAITFSVTWAISFRTFLVESMPRKTRSSGAALGQSSNWVANFTIALTTPILLAYKVHSAYFLWGSCTLFCTIVCLGMMVETGGHTLEQIEADYEKSQSAGTSTPGGWSLSSFQANRPPRRRAPPATPAAEDV